MSFKFNFSGGDKNDNLENESKSDIQWLESGEIKPNKQAELLDDISIHAKMFICGDFAIGHLIPSEVIESMGDQNNLLKLAEIQHSDLVAGSYEGGLKIWECTNDLIEYLIEHNEEIKLDKINVLDLGCGAGLLGIYTFMNGASVTFQDYNKEVLESTTIPNILLNIDEESNQTEEISKCRFFYGDWASFNEKLEETKQFDLILTSETIYNPDNHIKLIDIFSKRLAKDGVVYVAAKTCYFGVGGGTRQFEVALQKDGAFDSEVCWTSSGGIQREILKIKRKTYL